MVTVVSAKRRPRLLCESTSPPLMSIVAPPGEELNTPFLKRSTPPETLMRPSCKSSVLAGHSPAESARNSIRPAETFNSAENKVAVSIRCRNHMSPAAWLTRNSPSPMSASVSGTAGSPEQLMGEVKSMVSAPSTSMSPSLSVLMGITHSPFMVKPAATSMPHTKSSGPVSARATTAGP